MKHEYMDVHEHI